MSASKKANQSRPRRLVHEGPRLAFRLGPMVDTGTPISPCMPVKVSIPAALLSRWCRTTLRWRHRRGGAQDDDWAAFLVLGSSLQLGLCKLNDDMRRLFSRSETQNVPVDCNLAAANAEEPAEIDHGGAVLTGKVHDNVDDATHIFIRNAADLPAEHGLDHQRVKDFR